MNAISSSLKFGIDVIDRDHARLFELIGIIQEEHGKKTGKSAVILHAIKELREYANTHFKREEALMIASDYDAYNPHRVEHEYFENMIKAVCILYENNESLINLGSLMEVLQSWLINHIGIVDRAYVGSVINFCGRFQ